MKKVLIASRNPVKINATKKAFEEVFTNRFEFEGVSADSLVSDQPMSNDETLKGATNRLQNIQHLEADYLVSIEGGVDLLDNNYEAFAWIVISDKQKIGKAKTATFPLPIKISNLIKEGYELGDADDIVFKRSNSIGSNVSIQKVGSFLEVNCFLIVRGSRNRAQILSSFFLKICKRYPSLVSILASIKAFLLTGSVRTSTNH